MVIYEGTNANESKPATDKERETMVKTIEYHMESIMISLGIDLREDPHSKGTPKRVAKMWVNEVFSGRFEEPPSMTTFPNTKEMDQAIISGPIRIESTCSHHWMPFVGEAYIAYIPGETVLGISKLSRIATHYAKRPQIQEELTEQIANHIDDVLHAKGVAVLIKCSHQCMTCRGVHDTNAMMTTSSLRGAFKQDPATRAEFFAVVNSGGN